MIISKSACSSASKVALLLLLHTSQHTKGTSGTLVWPY
jgi:hypothetical protein